MISSDSLHFEAEKKRGEPTDKEVKKEKKNICIYLLKKKTACRLPNEGSRIIKSNRNATERQHSSYSCDISRA